MELEFKEGNLFYLKKSVDDDAQRKIECFVIKTLSSSTNWFALISLKNSRLQFTMIKADDDDLRVQRSVWYEILH